METSSETRAPNVIVIGIGGASGSGKSTLALSLEAALCITSEVRVLKMDEYFDPTKISRELDNNWEIPDSVDFQSYLNDTKETIAQALSNDRSEKVVYIILEGFLLFYWGEIAALCDLRVFISVPQDVARERRLSRVLARNANRNPHQFRQWYDR